MQQLKNESSMKSRMLKKPDERKKEKRENDEQAVNCFWSRLGDDLLWLFLIVPSCLADLKGSGSPANSGK